MIVLGPGEVYLEEGEVVPVFCTCGTIYQPEESSQKSRCPRCSRLNNHRDHTVTPMAAQ